MPSATTLTDSAVAAFRETVYDYYRAHGRDLPWRHTRDPYRILVSEFMLQQTQVPRVIEKYAEFLAAFPDIAALDRAPLAEVLAVWSGLGYNRRALHLKQCAGMVMERHNSVIPDDPAALRALPGIGPATAAEISAFAFGIPVPFIETNIRAVYIHHFFPGREDVDDREIMPIVDRTLDRDDPRTWYYALMDYGVHLKREHGNPARRSTHYVRQSAFEGSDRQIRGAIIRTLTASGPLAAGDLADCMDAEPERVAEQMERLVAEGFLVREDRIVRIAE